MKNLTWSLSLALILTMFSFESFAAYQSPRTCAEFEARFLKNKTVSHRSANEQVFRQWIDGSWDYTMQEYPEYATYVGYPGQNARWMDLSIPARELRLKILDCQINFAKKIQRLSLSPTDQLSYDLFLQSLQLQKEGAQFNTDLIPITQLEGIHSSLPDLIFASPKQSYKDFDDIFARLNSFPKVLEQTENLMRLGIEKKMTHVKFLMMKVPGQIEELVNSDFNKNPIYRDFKELPNFLTDNQKFEIQAKAKEALSTKVLPALKKLKTFIETEYIPKCRDEISAESLPNGLAYYNYSIRLRTTTLWDAKKIHEIGLAEVARLQKEMKALRDSLKFNGDQKAFTKFLNSDSQFFYRDPEDLISGYREIAKRTDPELPKLFKTLPRLPYGVKAMPDYKGSSGPTAYYQPGSPSSGRAGYFEANTFDLKSRPRWEMEALTMHEAVPGHHLQIAIAQELSELPEFRKNEGATAFVEGWGLYAESLGYDLGAYKDPYSRYGQLVYDMWRACRLVVDTGMHAMKWPKQKALDFMLDNVGKAKLDLENEVDRYITWPGQALAYKVGQMKFQELKEKSKKELGEKFDIREFHDEVLRHGAVPLSTLEKLHAEWLKKNLAQRTKR